MKKLLCICFTALVGIFASALVCAADWSNNKPLVLSKQVHNNSKLAFIPHVGKGKYANYLAMNINYEVIKPLFSQLEERVGRALNNRGEAHITVVTPVEYNEGLGSKLTINAINDIAKNIQKSAFEVVCLGRFETKLKGKAEQTYYVVVKSDDLHSIRKRIAEAFVKAGGKAKDFNENAFYPHITLGFSARDLHLSDGAKKDELSCLYPIVVE